jgi:hypothetical protein
MCKSCLPQGKNCHRSGEQRRRTATPNQTRDPAPDWVPDCKIEPWLARRFNGNTTCHWIVT